jgi:hypothetical protein
MRWSILLLIAACTNAPSSHEPPARIEPRTSAGEIPIVSLRPDAERALGLVVGQPALSPRQATTRVAGEVMVMNGRDVVIAAPLGGRINAARVMPRPGTRVKAGELLFFLVPLASVDRDVKARADRDVAAAKADYTLAQQRVERAKVMAADQSGSIRALQEAEALAETARASVAAAESRAKTLERGALDADVALPVTSPAEGVLRAVRVIDGQSVPAGAPLVELASAGRWIRATMAAGDAVRFRELAGASVQRIGDPTSVPAALIDGPPSADPLRGTVDRYFGVDVDWVPGERVIVQLVRNGGTGEMLSVPFASVVRDAEGGAWVYTQAGEHRFRRQRVSIERRDGDQLVVARGVSAETRLVSTGAIELWGFELGADQ